MKISLFKKNKIKKKEKLLITENGKTCVYTVSKKEEFENEAEAKKALSEKAYKEEKTGNTKTAKFVKGKSKPKAIN